MKVLLSHYGNLATLDRFKRVLDAQQLWGDPRPFVHRLYITDFDNDFKPPFPVVQTQFVDQQGRIRFAAIKNVAIDYAKAWGYDWWIEGDSDRFLARFPSHFPETGYAGIQSYCSHPGQTVEDIFKLYRDGKLPWAGSFFFMLRRDVFTKFRFCEEYAGFAFEDVDFRENVLAAGGVHESQTDARGIHISHPLEVAEKRHREAVAGKAIYRRRQWACGRQDCYSILSKEEALELDRKDGRG